MGKEHSVKLTELISTYCDGLSDDSHIERLEDVLSNNPDARAEFVEYLDMHAALSWLATPQVPSATEIVRANKQVELSSSFSSRLMERINRHGLLVLAASLLLTIGAYWLGVVNSSTTTLVRQSEEKPSNLYGTENFGVARITGLVDCKLGENQANVGFGQPIVSGQSIELSEGLLQFTFESGAKLVLQGPATFTAQSGMSADLAFGKVAAVVPEMARGYTIRTPSAEIVDLGTEFALDVDQQGSTEVHVLTGDVIARGRKEDGQHHGEAIHVRKDDALRFAHNTNDVERMRAVPGKFARKITPTLSKTELPPLPVVHDLKFWVAADLLVSRDEKGKVAAWRDVCIGDNQAANDACQFLQDCQPQWIADDGHKQAAIRFNGESTRLFTDSIDTGNRVTMFVACAPSEKGQNDTRWGGQLLNFGGQTPTIELAVHHNQQVYSGLWAANALGLHLVTGEVKSQKIDAGQRYILSYTYDQDLNRAELWVNGISQGTAPASLSPQINGPRTLGGHGYQDYTEAFYRGDIYEVLLYDTAVSEAERVAITNYLAKRYNTEVKTTKVALATELED